jgi:hypothetical protein
MTRIPRSRATLARAADRPDVLDGVDWHSVGAARLQIELFGPAVQVANARLAQAQEVVHAAAESRAQLWTRYQERRRRWESPDTSMRTEERAALERELSSLAGPA